MKRSGLFVILCVVAIAAIVSYIAATTPPRAANAGRSSKDFELISSVPDGPLILFRHAAPGDFYGRLGVVRLPLPAAGEAPRMIAPISCDWVHYASGRGVCMVARRVSVAGPVLTHTSLTGRSASSTGSRLQDRPSVFALPREAATQRSPCSSRGTHTRIRCSRQERL